MERKIRFRVSSNAHQGQAYEESIVVYRNGKDVFSLSARATEDEEICRVFEVKEGDKIVRNVYDFEEAEGSVTEYKVVKENNKLKIKEVRRYVNNFDADFDDLIRI